MPLKLHILSDIHLEFGKFHLPKTDADVLILAGDIGVGKSARNFIDECRKEVRTLYIPGNHEYYGGGPMEDVEKYWHDVMGDDFLQRKCTTINGFKIGGATLWTNMNQENPVTLLKAQWGMSDFNRGSTWQGEPWSAEASVERHCRLLEFLRIECPDIVMTHHAPSFDSIDSSRYNDPTLDGAYASALEQIFSDAWSPKLWVHGHIHKSNDYIIGTTRVVSNPRGYMNYAENPTFNPGLVVEVN